MLMDEGDPRRDGQTGSAKPPPITSPRHGSHRNRNHRPQRHAIYVQGFVKK
jgi:hypothetical protein